MTLQLTEKAARQMEQKRALEREAVELLAVIAAEFESDPTSVQCFDLRIVERSKAVTKQLRTMPDFL